MNFKELMDKYKNGSATDEEKRLVEEELEKYEIIEDYYSDMMGFDIEDSMENLGHKEESIKIKKSVNRKFKKIVLTSLGIILALLSSVFFILSPFVDGMYYNPTKVTVGESEMDIFFDLNAIIELNMPGYNLTSLIDVDKKGFGNYEISFSRTNLFSHEYSQVNSKLEKNEQFHMYTRPFENLFGTFKSVQMPDFYDYELVQQTNEEVMDHLKQLSPVSYISSWLTFEDDLTMDELHQLKLDNPNIHFGWVAVRTPPSDEVFNLLGFSPSYGISVMVEDTPDLEKYPALNMREFLVNPGMAAAGEMYLEPTAYDLHYIDLLKYVVDRKEAIDALEFSQFKHQFYEQALEYTQEHGVKSYGILAFADAGDLIDFVDNGPIYHIEIDDIAVSRKSIH